MKAKEIIIAGIIAILAVSTIIIYNNNLADCHKFYLEFYKLNEEEEGFGEWHGVNGYEYTFDKECRVRYWMDTRLYGKT